MCKVLFFFAYTFVLISCSDSETKEESKYVFKGSALVVFSEIHAANADYKDEFGEKPGWVEFYNPADTTVNLKGYSLANTSNANGTLWTFGDVVIQSHSYLTVFFSGRDIPDLNLPSNIHVSFELNANGGELFLIDSQQQTEDSVAYPAAIRDLSFAKYFESGKWAFSKPPTPNSANSYESYEGQAQQISESSIPKSGYFEKELSFTLPVETEHGIIRCDTSGAVPNESSMLKSGTALNLTKTAVLRCVQFKQGVYPSEPILRTYIIGERLPSLPVVSIAVNPIDMFDPTIGIYVNYWKDIELPIQIDFFENGTKHAWSHSAGIRIHGYTSRAYPKKSVAIGFKKKYGQKNLIYPLFPKHPNLTKFNWFILRNNGGNFDKDYIRDMLMTSLTEGLGIDYQKGRSVIVYYNGEYFGIYNLRERGNVDYFDTNYGIDENNIDFVKLDLEATHGSDADYQDILKWLGNVALDDENLESLKKRIDLDNYTNYLQSEIYFSNKDWPGSNLKRWRSRIPVSKWKWFLYDTDIGFDSWNPSPQIKMLYFVTDPNGPNHPNPPHTTFLTRKLLENQNYKNAFINRFSLLLATYYTPARVESKINALMNPIESEIPLDQRRWSFSANHMNNQLTMIKNFGKNRSTEMQKEIEEFFGLGCPINLTLKISGNGKILVHNLPVLNNNATFKVYSTVPIIIKAVPNGGAKFKGWSDGDKNAERTIIVEQATTLRANF